MTRQYSPIDLAEAAGKLTKFARQNGYPDWDMDSAELAIAQASRRIAEREGISKDDAVKEVVGAVLNRTSAKLIPVF